MFLAFAVLFPDMTVLLFFIIPIKIKWLAIIDGVFFAIEIVGAILSGNVVGAITPVLALLNFCPVCHAPIYTICAGGPSTAIRRGREFPSDGTLGPKSSSKMRLTTTSVLCAAARMRTIPDPQFRYCSKCAGYHCFCQDHIFSHVHFTERSLDGYSFSGRIG